MGVLNLGKNKFQADTDWKTKSSLSGGDSLEFFLELAAEKQLQAVPFDIEGLISNLNDVELHQHPMDSDISGYFKKTNGKWVIGVNSKHHYTRRRFTLAHELGHYALHRQLNIDFEDTTLFRDGDTNAMEWEANQFAANLLMPRNEFMNALKRSSSIDDLSKHFDVSPLAVKVRAIQMGYSVSA